MEYAKRCKHKRKRKRIAHKLNKIGELMLNLRDKLRNGEVLEGVGYIEINCIKSAASNYPGYLYFRYSIH